jgi:hypothetical protein
MQKNSQVQWYDWSNLTKDVMGLREYVFVDVSAAMSEIDRSAAIRRNYATFQRQVDAGLGDWNHPCPYDIADWASVLTAIEFGAWQDIRSGGQMPLWPRLPVEDVVISFGNPVAKVALLCSTDIDEVDAQTAIHASRLRDLGWAVATATGRQCTVAMEMPAERFDRTGEDDAGYALRYQAETLQGKLMYLGERVYRVTG